MKKNNDHPTCPMCGRKLKKSRTTPYGDWGVCKECDVELGWDSNRPSNRSDLIVSESEDYYETDGHGRLVHVTHEE